MLTTFKYTLISQLKNGSMLFWVLLFPIVLATLFSVMFGGLEEQTELDPIPTGIVYETSDAADDATQTGAPNAVDAFRSTVDALATGDDALLDPREASSLDEARDWQVREETRGTIIVSPDGMPSLEITPLPGDPLDVESISQTVLGDIVSNFTRSWASIEDIAQDNPQALMDSTVIEALTDPQTYTQEIVVTYSQAAESVRYFYALLGFAALMAATLGMSAVSRTLPNISSLGARRCVSGTSRLRTLAGSLLASWLLSFFALLVAFAYMRFVLDIGFGGRDASCIIGLAVASLMTTALGSLIGALPKISEGGKSGMLTGITCFLSLFAGLYGTPAMNLADEIARNAPALALINPAKQVTDLFYCLYVYPDLQPFAVTVCVLLAMTLVFAVIAALLMRRQSYAHL